MRGILASDSFVTPVHVCHSLDLPDSPLLRGVTVEIFPGAVVVGHSYKFQQRTGCSVIV